MPWDSLPESIDEPFEWSGKDDDKYWFTRWRKSIKGWFAYSYRSKRWWARWREFPVLLASAKGKGVWRLENDSSECGSSSSQGDKTWYLSRVQYWCRWHIQVQWPLFFAFHIYWKDSYVPKFPDRASKVQNIKYMFYFYFGASRDSDKVYWFPAIFIGGSWK